MLQTCYDVYGSFHIMHRELPLLRAVPAPVPEIYTVIESFFPPSHYHKYSPTAVYANHYNFLELNAVEYLREAGLQGPATPDRIVVGLPYADYANPLMWCALAHEMGHAFEKNKSIVAAVLPELGVTELPVLESWAKELVADQVGLRLLGPAYYNAFVALLFTVDPTRFVPSESHPQPHARFNLIHNYLTSKAIDSDSATGYRGIFTDLVTEFEVREHPGEYSGSFTCSSCHREWPVTIPAPHVDLAELWTGIAARVAADPDFQAMTEYTPVSAKAAQSLSGLLERGQPIPAFRSAPDAETLRAVEKILSDPTKLATITTEESYALLARIQETPAGISEILNAAWDHRHRRAVPIFMDIFGADRNRGKEFAFAPQQWVDKWMRFRDHLNRLDYRLQKSIESSELHRMLTGKYHAAK